MSKINDPTWRHRSSQQQHQQPHKSMDTPPPYDNSPNPLLVTASYDQTIRLWSLTSGKSIGAIPHQESQVNTMSLTSTGRDLAVGGWQRVRIYDVTSGKDPKATIELPKNVTVVGFEAAGRWMFTGGDDGVCRIWEMRNNQLVANRLLTFTPTQITSVAPNLNQTDLFIATSTGEVFIWDVINHTYMRLPLPDSMIRQECVQRLSVHPSGKRLVGVTNKARIFVWDLMTREVEAASFDMFKSPAVPVEQETTTYGVLRDEEHLYEMSKLGYGLSCRHSCDGKYIVTSSSHSDVHLINAETMEVVRELDVGCRWNWDAILSTEGRYLFTGGNDNLVKIWDTNNGKKVAQWEGHTKPITAMCLNSPMIQH